MPTTRKKVIKTVYKDESEDETGDFSDSGSEAKISGVSSSEDEDIDEKNSSGDDFNSSSKATKNKQLVRRKAKFAKDLISKINKQTPAEDVDTTPALFSVKDLTDEDKLLPSVLNLSESDSSDDECDIQSKKKIPAASTSALTSIYEHNSDSDNDVTSNEYRDVWSNNKPEDSEEIAKKAFMDLETHTKEIEQTKASIQNYISKKVTGSESNVKDLLAAGEQIIENKSPMRTKNKSRKRKDDSDSDIEDWEEVKESKSIPQQGLQLFVELPDAVCRKNKKLDVEMMMKRKINRVKKEYQVYMHKVHVLCWLGHGIYVNQALNDREVMAAALAMVPKGCYPEERVTMKYVEQITTWLKDKLVLKQDKNEHKFKPKAPALKTILLNQIKMRVTTAKKYNTFIYVTMLRALGLQCRIMFNFVTLPIRPPSSELCSLSTKRNDDNSKVSDKSANNAPKSSNKNKEKGKTTAAVKSKPKCNANIAQVDGICDTFSESDSDNENIMQLDGNSDPQTRSRSTRSTRAKKVDKNEDEGEDEGVSPPKRAKTENDTKIKPTKLPVNKAATISNDDKIENATKTRKASKSINEKKGNIKDKLQESQKSPAEHIKSDKGATKAKRGASKSPHSINNSVLEISDKDKISNLSDKANVDDSALKVTKRKSIEDESQKFPAAKRAIKRKAGEDTTKAKRVTSKSPQLKDNELDTCSQAKAPSPQSSLGLSNRAKIKNPTTLKVNKSKDIDNSANSCKTRSATNSAQIDLQQNIETKLGPPTILVTDENSKKVESEFFSEPTDKPAKLLNISRKRSRTNIVEPEKSIKDKTSTKRRTKSAPGTAVEKSKYFDSDEAVSKKPKLNTKQAKKLDASEDKLRVSHKDLLKQEAKPKNDVTGDLINIMKNRIKVEKAEAKKGIIKGKAKNDSDDDSDFLPVEDPKSHDSDDDFKPTKISPRPIKVSPKASLSKKIDRRVLSSDDDAVKSNKMDVWCEVFVEELEQWVAVDILKGKVHCANELYTNATHPICYIVGWDNNNYLKDLTRRYVPHWNTVTRKQRAEPEWWQVAIQPWLGPKTARDREEDEQLDRMQLEAPLPKSIAEYKNHPLYALKRHLLKFEALYPPDAATLGFVRGEAVYSRDCVYTCRSRDTWVKEAKVVKLGEQPYKVVKARPKWDKLSNKLITDKPLEVFGPWQVQDYEPPTAENGKVPRNAYGNVELFKACMLPKGTVHIKLPGLNKVARKLNIDCAPAMTGFDFNGGWSHPVYDGFVVCSEFEEIITDAWVKEQEEQERREREKTELRVYGNWRRLIRGLMIRERLKLKYGFEEPTTSTQTKSKGPRLVVKKKY